MTIQSTDWPELDIAGVSAAYERRVREACPDQLAPGLRLLDRLQPARWMLEWHLPWWLGQAFRLDPDDAAEIVLSNVLGLGSIRLQDDLADGDIPAEDVASAGILSATLYEAALEPYRSRFQPASPFWIHLDSSMADWRAATRDEDRRLAARGAPLTISVVAVCLLADRPDAFPALDQCLGHALEAMVLYDHVADWEADLHTGRWNAFVAGVSSASPTPGNREARRRAVLVAMMTTDALGAHVARIEAGMLRAAALADALEVPVPALGAFFRAFAIDARVRGTAWERHYHDLGERAAKLLLNPNADVRS